MCTLIPAAEEEGSKMCLMTCLESHRRKTHLAQQKIFRRLKTLLHGLPMWLEGHGLCFDGGVSDLQLLKVGNRVNNCVLDPRFLSQME